MNKFLINAGKILLDILFPIFCVNCQKEGIYLCEDCFVLVETTTIQYCPFCRPPRVALNGEGC